MKKLFLVLSLVLLSVTFLSADVYIKSNTHTGAVEMMGQKQPAKDEVTEMWIGDGKFTTITSGQSMTLDLNKMKMYIIYPETKKYVETDLPLDMAKLMPEQAAQMLSMMKISATVTANGQTKKIGQWNCTGYNAEIKIQAMMEMKMNMTIWASKDVPFDWKAYSEKMYPAILKAQSGSMPFGDDIVNEFKKIEGFQIASEMSMNVMGANIHITTEVQEISKKPAPAGIYAVPAGFTKQDKMTVKRGM